MNFVVIRSRSFLRVVLRRDLFLAARFGASYRSILGRTFEPAFRAVLRSRDDFRVSAAEDAQSERCRESAFRHLRSSEHQTIADDPIHNRVNVSRLDHDGVATELSFG